MKDLEILRKDGSTLRGEPIRWIVDKIIQLDNEDYDRASRYKWYIDSYGTIQGRTEGKKRTYIASFLFGAKGGDRLVFKNGNRDDYTRSNVSLQRKGWGTCAGCGRTNVVVDSTRFSLGGRLLCISCGNDLADTKDMLWKAR